MKAKTSLECKNYNHEEWKLEAKELCKPGIRAKFCTSSTLTNLLLSTGEKMIVEACHDELWGTGIPLQDKNCLVRENWTGQGIMGEILTELRQEFFNNSLDTSNAN